MLVVVACTAAFATDRLPSISATFCLMVHARMYANSAQALRLVVSKCWSSEPPNTAAPVTPFATNLAESPANRPIDCFPEYCDLQGFPGTNSGV